MQQHISSSFFMVVEIINGLSIAQYKTNVDRMVVRRNRLLETDIRPGKEIDYSCPALYLGAFRRLNEDIVQPVVGTGRGGRTFVDAGLRRVGLIAGIQVLGSQIERIRKPVFNKGHRC